MAEPKKPAASTPAPSASATDTERQPIQEDTSFSEEETKVTPGLSEAERQELEQFRAEKAAREAVVVSATKEDRKPNLDLDPTKDREAFLQLSVEDQIRAHYLHARGTIQDYARLFKLTVEEVLHILGHDDMVAVETIGDQIDQKELGPNAQINPRGQLAEANFSIN